MSGRVSRETAGKFFATSYALIFIGAGLAGLLPPLHTEVPADAPSLKVDILYVKNVGLLPVNILHTLAHWTFAFLAVAALLGVFSIGAYARGMAIVLTVFTVMGLLPGFRTTFGLFPLYGHVIWFHAIEAAIAGYVGFVLLRSPADTAQAARVAN
jgi:hypothetical protein